MKTAFDGTLVYRRKWSPEISQIAEPMFNQCITGFERSSELKLSRFAIVIIARQVLTVRVKDVDTL